MRVAKEIHVTTRCWIVATFVLRNSLTMLRISTCLGTGIPVICPIVTREFYTGDLKLKRESPYETLGIPPGSHPSVVKRAYLREIKTWHPDRYAPDSILRETAEERTRAVTVAYAALVAEDMGSNGGSAASEGRTAVRRNTAPSQTANRVSDPHSTARPAGSDWLGRFWRRLKVHWRDKPTTDKKPTTPQPGSVPRMPTKTRTRGQAAHRKRSARLGALPDQDRRQPTASKGSAISWREMVTRRSQYRRRACSTGAIRPVTARGPVFPVDPIGPIGEDD